VANLGFDPLSFSSKASYSKSGKLKVIFAGTLTGRKGIDLLLKASKELEEIMELTLVGPMADSEEILNQYKGYYTWHPFADHTTLNKLFSQSDLFAFPSYLDSWAMVVTEAMACGLPVIISENTGAKESVKDGGFIIPVGDLEALKNKILDFYDDRNSLEVLGKKAREASLKYTWNAYYDKVKSIMDRTYLSS
jgi:glycosyltransferase involved in cell wall biosynthesis